MRWLSSVFYVDSILSPVACNAEVATMAAKKARGKNDVAHSLLEKTLEK